MGMDKQDSKSFYGKTVKPGQPEKALGGRTLQSLPVPFYTDKVELIRDLM